MQEQRQEKEYLSCLLPGLALAAAAAAASAAWSSNTSSKGRTSVIWQCGIDEMCEGIFDFISRYRGYRVSKEKVRALQGIDKIFFVNLQATFKTLFCGCCRLLLLFVSG